MNATKCHDEEHGTSADRPWADDECTGLGPDDRERHTAAHPPSSRAERESTSWNADRITAVRAAASAGHNTNAPDRSVRSARPPPGDSAALAYARAAL